MHIISLLTSLGKLETQLSQLYERFSKMFRDDPEASAFFYQMSVDEAAHADLVRFERRIVAADTAHFKEVDADIGEIEKISSRVGLLLKSEEELTIEEALRISLEIEHSVAEEHYTTAITLSNPGVTGLLNSLTAFDGRHFRVFEDFAEKRGHAPRKGTPEHTDITLPGRSRLQHEEIPDAGHPAPQRPIRVSQEYIDRINYLYTWHKTMGYYKVLGIRNYATEVQIRQAYRTAAKEFHPDLHMDLPDDLKEKLNTIFSFMSAAYVTLSDPRKRKEYDGRLPARQI